MRVMILTADSNGGYPVPAVRGGAVSTLIEHLVAGNNKKKLCDMTVVSYYDSLACEKAIREYPNVKFVWIKIPAIVKFMDYCAFHFVKLMGRRMKAGSFKSPFSLLYYIYKAKKIINKTDADRLVLENNVPLVRVLRGSQYKGKVYYHFHNTPRIDAGCGDIFKTRIDKFLCVSKFLARQICSNDSKIGSISKNKVVALYNCINTDRFKKISDDNNLIIRFKEKFGIRKNDFVIIFVGRLVQQKGIDILVKALKELPESVKLLIVGSFAHNINVQTPFQKNLHNMISNMNNRVVFTGYVSQDELPYFYNLANIGVFPSMWGEAAGLTNLEAMACGIPIITTDSGGIPEYVGDSIIVKRDADIVNNIVEKIKELMENKKESERLGEYEVSYVKKHFSTNDYINRFVTALQ